MTSIDLLHWIAGVCLWVLLLAAYAPRCLGPWIGRFRNWRARR